MPKARRLKVGATFDPETLKALGHLFDEVWASAGPDVGDDPHEIEAARMRLGERPERSGGVSSKQEM